MSFFLSYPSSANQPHFFYLSFPLQYWTISKNKDKIIIWTWSKEWVNCWNSLQFTWDYGVLPFQHWNIFCIQVCMSMILQSAQLPVNRLSCEWRLPPVHSQYKQLIIWWQSMQGGLNWVSSQKAFCLTERVERPRVFAIAPRPIFWLARRRNWLISSSVHSRLAGFSALISSPSAPSRKPAPPLISELRYRHAHGVSFGLHCGCASI